METVKGLAISSDLKWSQHISNTCAKAKHKLGMLYRHFHQADQQTLSISTKLSSCPTLTGSHVATGCNSLVAQAMPCMQLDHSNTCHVRTTLGRSSRQWRPREDKNLLQRSQLSQHGEFWHVSVSKQQRSHLSGQNLCGAFVRAVLAKNFEESNRAMAANGTTKALVSPPPR